MATTKLWQRHRKNAYFGRESRPDRLRLRTMLRMVNGAEGPLLHASAQCCRVFTSARPVFAKKSKI